jgi:hypothetical protein
MKGIFREAKRINWKLTLFGTKKRTGITFLIMIPTVVGAAGFGYQYYLQLNPAIAYQHNLNKMTQQVGKTVALPSDEQPTVATVTDKNILPKEAFFASAQNGDKIFMYKKHKLAVLYRPSLGVVITKATLLFQDSTPTPAPKDTAVAGASSSANPDQATAVVTVGPTVPYHPQGKILVLPQK